MIGSGKFFWNLGKALAKFAVCRPKPEALYPTMLVGVNFQRYWIYGESYEILMERHFISNSIAIYRGWLKYPFSSYIFFRNFWLFRDGNYRRQSSYVENICFFLWNGLGVWVLSIMRGSPFNISINMAPANTWLWNCLRNWFL